MRKATLTPEEQLATAEQVAEGIKSGGRLVISINSTSKSNMSYKYAIRLVYAKDGQIQDRWLNYWFASCYGESLTDYDELRGNGVGTDRYFQASYEVGTLLKKFGLIEDVYDATRNYIRAN
jgi:hypothetical protein